MAVGQRDGRDVAVPVFITDVSNGRYEIADMGGSVRPGMPVYNLDGELLAIAAGDGPPAQAYPAGDSTRRLLAISSADQGRASLGLALQPLTGALAGAFGEQGALIADVVTGGPGDQAGIEPGDVLRGVGDSEIANIDEATRALRLTAPGTVVALRVVRSGRLRTLEATAASVFEVATLARVVGQETPAGLDARALFPAASLRDANVPSAAVVLGVNGRAVASLAQVRRDLRGARRPVTLLLRHDGRRFFAVLEPRR
ncbi:MAG: PDZ domain-containing protein [Vicinamibacteria bacterium]|nr:PDZ domain-containing protein [Vicinamibacteria bacterium]